MIRSLGPAERRLVLVVGAIVFVDTMFYAAIAPLLPTLAHQLHLSKLSAGVMTASYPSGHCSASIPGGLLAARAGPKITVTLGLGAARRLDTRVRLPPRSRGGLDIARFVEGIGGACSWTGGLAWIVAEAPPARRGELIGAALGAAIGGALFGPVIGTIATAAGRAATFSGVVVSPSADHRRPPPARAPHHLRSGRPRAVRRPARPRNRRRHVARDTAGDRVRGDQRARPVADAPARRRRRRDRRRISRRGRRRGGAQPTDRPSGRTAGPRWLRCAFGLVAVTVLLLCFTLPEDARSLGVVVVALAAALGRILGPGDGDALGGRRASRSRPGPRRGADEPRLGRGSDRRLGRGRRRRQVAGDGVPMAITAGLCATTPGRLALARRAPARPGRVTRSPAQGSSLGCRSEALARTAVPTEPHPGDQLR